MWREIYWIFQAQSRKFFMTKLTNLRSFRSFLEGLLCNEYLDLGVARRTGLVIWSALKHSTNGVNAVTQNLRPRKYNFLWNKWPPFPWKVCLEELFSGCIRLGAMDYFLVETFKPILDKINKTTWRPDHQKSSICTVQHRDKGHPSIVSFFLGWGKTESSQ
jgi:hypothetical protein